MKTINYPAPTAKFPIELYQCKFDEPFETVCKELKALSEKLQELLPDPSLSPDERLERLARVIPDSILASAHHQTARMKLKRLRNRLTELVPDRSMSSLQKVDFLIHRVHELVPGDEPRLFKKLEALGDHRVSDLGR